ncbi:MAG TPA: hypothetical protein VK693_11140 [Steroidobacteraceae bacterium]|jgi:hypothetical protein|nr:hypothetical protein [Steroidobacteraceae bacterium]
MTWQQLEARKTAIIARMVALEELEQTEAPDQTEALSQEALSQEVACDYAA